MQKTPFDDSQAQVPVPSGTHTSSTPQVSLNTQTVSVAPPEQQPPFFYLEDQEDHPAAPLPLVDEQQDLGDQDSPFVLPFQISTPMPSVTSLPRQAAPATTPVVPSPTQQTGTARRLSKRVMRLLLITGVVLLTLLGASIFVFAQPTPGTPHPDEPRTKAPTSAPKAPPAHPVPTTAPTPGASPSPQPQGTGTLPAETVPSPAQLAQLGWTQAGLVSGDALEAMRTADAFTDREMSYDYRNIGTVTAHGGTLTSSMFLLTLGGKKRFVLNDVRMINNTLYDKIQNGKIIQQVIAMQASLVQFQVVPIQGQNQAIAWVDVAFELFQSKLNPATGARVETAEVDATTHQPVIHHLIVVLVRIPPQNQGVNAPMGGTGWLVNTYELDRATLPVVATNPSL